MTWVLSVDRVVPLKTIKHFLDCFKLLVRDKWWYLYSVTIETFVYLGSTFN